MILIEPDQRPDEKLPRQPDIVDDIAKELWAIFRLSGYGIVAWPLPVALVAVVVTSGLVRGAIGLTLAAVLGALAVGLASSRRGRRAVVATWYWQAAHARCVMAHRDARMLGVVLGVRDRHGNGRRVVARYDRDGKLTALDVDARGVGAVAIERQSEVWLSTLCLAPGTSFDLRPGKHRGQVIVDIVPPYPPLPTIVTDLRLVDESGALVLGVREDGRELTWDPTRSPHLLLSGATGSGKTWTIRRILRAAEAAGYELWVADHYKGTYSAWASERPGVRHAVAKPDIARMCVEAAEEMQRRYEVWRADRGVTFQPIMLVLDEAADLLDADTGRSEEAKTDQALVASIRSAITTIGRLGREARVHLVVAPQRGDAALLGGQLREQLTFRLLQLSNAKDGTIGMALELSRDSMLHDHVPPVRIRDLDAFPGRVLAEVNGGKVVLAQVAAS